MIIIGGKKILLDLNKLIDSFDQNIRVNLSLPNGTNGTKIDKLALNPHVFENFITLKLDLKTLQNKFYPDVDREALKYLKDITDNISHKKIIEVIDKNSFSKTNKILSSLKCTKLKKLGRCGIQAIIRVVNDGDEIPFIYGFSLQEKDNVTFYNTKPMNIECHSAEEEFKIIKDLHKMGKIDATLCLLENNEKPILNCRELTPTKKGIDLLKKYFDNVYMRENDKQEIVII